MGLFLAAPIGSDQRDLGTDITKQRPFLDLSSRPAPSYMLIFQDRHTIEETTLSGTAGIAINEYGAIH